MLTRTLTAACVAALILTDTPATPPAHAGPAATSRLDLSAAKRKKPARRAAPRREIACTAFGCRPVPPSCYQREGLDFWGNPSGFDVIICPRR